MIEYILQDYIKHRQAHNMLLSYVEFAEILANDTRANIDRHYIDILNTFINSNGGPIMEPALEEKAKFLSRNSDQSTYRETYQTYWIQRYTAERELERHQAVLDMEDGLQKLVIDNVMESFVNPHAKGDLDTPIMRIVTILEQRILDRIMLRFDKM